MAKQYWVDEFYVDLSRNQISQQDQVQSMPPKALQVLTYLAENNGRVVSYDELLNAVWPSSVVTPNTLQRSVAQLRKALGETSKTQGIVKTHSKQGYSLECKVTWDRETGTTASNGDVALKIEDSEPMQVLPLANQAFSIKKHFRWMAGCLLVLIVVIFLLSIKNEAVRFEFGNLRYITATDNKEYGARYSSDGKFILFHRYYDRTCVNHLWAKNSETMEEVQLTKEKGTYDSYSLSPDGKILAYIQQQDCAKPVSQLNCYTLKALNFEQALSQPQEGEALLYCENSAIKSPVWVDADHIAMMQNKDQSWRIILYSHKNNSSETLYAVDSGNIVHFTFSAKHGALAVVSINADGQKFIETISLEGEVLSSELIQLPPKAPRHLGVRPEYISNSDKLVFGSFGQLYTLTEQGEVRNMNFPFDRYVGAPSFHPEGGRLLLISGHFDSDVAIAHLPGIAGDPVDPQNNEISFSVFERSTQSEYLAKFQPNGGAIAMVSERTGTEQVWLFDGGKAKPISQFTKGTFIKSLHWSYEGNSILALANNELYILMQDEAAKVIDFPYPVVNLFHWNSSEGWVVANILVGGSQKFVEIDLNSAQYEVVNSKNVKWAAISDSGILVFRDDLNRVWQSGAIEEVLIESLQNQVSAKRFLFKKELLYGVNDSDQLWSYNMDTDEFKSFAVIDRDFEYLSDIRGEDLLLTFVVSAKKEVLEVDVNKF